MNVYNSNRTEDDHDSETCPDKNWKSRWQSELTIYMFLAKIQHLGLVCFANGNSAYLALAPQLVV